MSDIESNNQTHRSSLNSDDVLNDHRNQTDNNCAISDDEYDPLTNKPPPSSNQRARSHSHSNTTHMQGSGSGMDKARKKSTRRRSSINNEKYAAQQNLQKMQQSKVYMSSLKKDFNLNYDEDNSNTYPTPILNKRKKSTIDEMIRVRSNTSQTSNSNLQAPSQQQQQERRPSRSSIDSEADSHASRSSQETEEDVCFPMLREHVRINGIDFDEIDEFIREEREETEMQQQFLGSTKSNDCIGYQHFSSATSVNTGNRSSAAMKYTPKNLLKTLTREKIIEDSTSSDEVELKPIRPETEQVKFGGARISDGTNGALPDRFSFFHSENEETVHSPDIQSLITPDQSIRELFKNGEKTWWLDCTCPTDSEMKMLAKAFGIHPLTAEDIRMQETREKVELFRSYYFVCFHTFEPDKESEDYLEPINVYIVVFRDGVLSFHFSPINHPANVRRRVRQLRDYVDVTADWLCYALIDDITDGFAPIIHGIEYEADAIEDDVFVARDTDFSNMLQRIGDSRRKVMTLMRLLSGKADVIKMFAKRCQDEAAGLQSQSHHQLTSPESSSVNIPPPTQQQHQQQQQQQAPPSSSQQQFHPQAYNWQAQNYDAARPRADIALYLGDIQDHIITMFQNLSAYEKIFSRSHSNYLAQLQVESFNSNNKITQMFSKVTIIGTMLVPLNLVTGLFGMNVRVPGEGGGNLAWFFGIVGVLIVIICLSLIFANWWLNRLNRKMEDGESKPIFNSRRSIRSLGMKRSAAKSIISFPNKYE